MKQGYTHISAIIDRSGSMESIRTDTEGGFNVFLRDQKEQPGEATISLTTFDDLIEIEYAMIPIRDAPLFVLTPRGYTALLDAVGVTIQNLGEKLAAMDEPDRPEKVLVVIVTDGQENHSREYSYDQIRGIIEEQTRQYSWEFLFLGANQDAILAGGRLGIPAGKSINYAANSPSVRNTYNTLSRVSSSYRSSAKGVPLADFTYMDRAVTMILPVQIPDPAPTKDQN